jgi:uroporphyrinogen-III synthase
VSAENGARVLAGVTVVWTGSRGSAKTLFTAVEANGATLLRLPLIETGPPRDPGAVCRVFSSPTRFSWMVFTSAEAVRAVSDKLSSEVPCAAVGPATAAQLTALGHPPDLVPETSDGVSLAEAIIGVSPKEPVLFVRGNRALDTLPNRLKAAGVPVTNIEVYSTRPVGLDRASAVCDRLRQVADVVAMGSPSGVETLRRVVTPKPLSVINERILWVSLGKATMYSLLESGAKRVLRLSSLDPEALVQTLSAFLG